MPTAARYDVLGVSRASSSYAPQAADNITPMKMKSLAVQFTSLVNCIATAGNNSSNAAVPQIARLQRFLRRALGSSMLRAIAVSPWLGGIGTSVARQSEVTTLRM